MGFGEADRVGELATKTCVGLQLYDENIFGETLEEDETHTKAPREQHACIRLSFKAINEDTLNHDGTQNAFWVDAMSCGIKEITCEKLEAKYGGASDLMCDECTTHLCNLDLAINGSG